MNVMFYTLFLDHDTLQFDVRLPWLVRWFIKVRPCKIRVVEARDGWARLEVVDA